MTSRSRQHEPPLSREIRRAMLRTLQDRGMPATDREISEAVGDVLRLTRSQRETSAVRIRQAREDLEEIRVLRRTASGELELTEDGETIAISDAEARIDARQQRETQTLSAWSQLRYPGTQAEDLVVLGSATDRSEGSRTGDRSQQRETHESSNAELLELLLDLSPSEFEHLTKELLIAFQYEDVEVTQRSRDGGIDGHAILPQGLTSFPIYFQCKRYQGSVGAAEMRDFRGALVGRYGQGLFVTTGSFTKDAVIEAERESAIRIDLIDGDRLCELLTEQEIGPRSSQQPPLFDQFEDSP